PCGPFIAIADLHILLRSSTGSSFGRCTRGCGHHFHLTTITAMVSRTAFRNLFWRRCLAILLPLVLQAFLSGQYVTVTVGILLRLFLGGGFSFRTRCHAASSFLLRWSWDLVKKVSHLCGFLPLGWLEIERVIALVVGRTHTGNNTSTSDRSES